MIFDAQEQIKVQMAIADGLLHKLEAIDPFCILAGGAPRDWWLGKPARDLDFYFHSNNPLKSVNLQLSRAGIEVVGGRHINSKENLYKTLPTLSRIIYCIAEGSDIQIQLMQLSKKTFGVIDEFACGVSKVWYKAGRIVPSQDFLLGHKTKSIVLNNGYEEDDFYIKKIKHYFPEYLIRSREEAQALLE